MKYVYDDNNFVWQGVTRESCVCEYPGLRENIPETCPFKSNGTTCNYIEDPVGGVGNLLDLYGLPRYKIYNETLTLITDPADYQIDSKLWELYLVRLKDEVRELIKTKTDVELQTIYNSSPLYKQEMIYTQIEELQAGKISQVTFNLSVEVMIRVLIEKEYITNVLQRSLTEDEQTAFNAILTQIHDHSIGMDMPMSINSWWQTFISNMMVASDTLRTETLTKRFFITGRY